MSVKHVCIQSEPGLWTVGHYNPQDDRWISDSDHGTREQAVDRVIELNGGETKANRRDRFAAAALTGLLANPDITAREWTSEQRATVARIQADDMIASFAKVRP